MNSKEWKIYSKPKTQHRKQLVNIQSTPDAHRVNISLLVVGHSLRNHIHSSIKNLHKEEIDSSIY